MADTVRVSNMPESGSRERVAYDLFVYLRNLHPKDEDPATKAHKLLQFYSECLSVVQGGTPKIDNLK